MIFAQVTIEGRVQDVSGEKLTGCLVTVGMPSSTTILNYGVTDKDGNYEIILDYVSEKLVIKASYLGYKSKSKNIDYESQTVNFLLEESSEMLEEVIVKSSVILKRGDTLSYSVSAFKNQQDRVIADVIEKMPGLQILPNGQILYQGTPIEKYYIEGMDMLEGRYNLANENISADDVSKVQVLENHQPIKILDSISTQNKTSLNIKLKKKISFSANTNIGFGMSPAIYNLDLNSLLFTKENQGLFTYQFNTVGKNVLRNTYNFSSADRNIPTLNTYQKTFLYIQNIPRPPLKPERFLDNRDHFSSLNFLQRLKNGSELKINLSYLNSEIYERGEKTSIYRIEDDIISIEEITNNVSFKNRIYTNLVWENNKTDKYSKHNLSFDGFNDSKRGIIQTNNTDIIQNLSIPYGVIDYDINLIRIIGNQLLSIQSDLSFSNSNEYLTTSPNFFLQETESTDEGSKLEQRLKFTDFSLNGNAGLTKKIGLSTLKTNTGFSVKSQDLISELKNTPNDNQIPPQFQNNDLKFNQFNFFISNALDITIDDWEIALNLPVVYRNINNQYFIQDNPLIDLKKLVIEPRIQLSKKINAYWEGSLNAEQTYLFGDIERLHTGVILRNYRALVNYNPFLTENKQILGNVQIKYRNSLKALFSQFTMSYKVYNRNYLYSNRISEESIITQEALAIDNKISVKAVSIDISKYSRKFKSTIRFASSISINETPSIINGEITTFNQIIQNYGGELNSDFTDWLSLKAETSYGISELKTDLSSSTIKSWVNSATVFFYINERRNLNLDFENENIKITNTLTNNFFNLNYDCQLLEGKVDLRLSWINILNIKDYNTAFNDNFFSIQSSYNVRPSQILLNIKFSL